MSVGYRKTAYALINMRHDVLIHLYWSEEKALDEFDKMCQRYEQLRVVDDSDEAPYSQEKWSIEVEEEHRRTVFRSEKKFAELITHKLTDDPTGE